MRRRILFAVGCLVLPSIASAWSTKEHVQLTRLAAMQLIADAATPVEMKRWLADAAPGLLDMAGERDYLMNERMGIVPRGVDGLAYWAVMPDMVTLMDKRNEKLAPWNVPEGLLHYFDLEFYIPDGGRAAGQTVPKASGKELLGEDNTAGGADAPKPFGRPDPSKKPTLADIPRDLTDKRLAEGGASPYRVADCYEHLVKSIRDGKLVDRPGQFPRDEHATRWAGYLAHYLQDSTQPQHASKDYQSRAFFPAGVKSPNAHSVMEYEPVDDEFADYPQLREQYWPLLTAALKDARELADSDDPWTATVQTYLISYDALPLIGEAAVSAWDKDAPSGSPKVQGKIDVVKFYNHRGQVFGREMSVLELKAHQQAWAVAKTKAAWLKAWKEATAEAEAPMEHIGP